ncbi:MAG: hypothetical protein QF473_02550 [Planctomycetota bacterium]|nr:hypothetical protein [Planctomycetota bacterium]
MRNHHDAAFTLIDLLAVIGILAVLLIVALAIPALSKATDTRLCMSKARSIVTLMRAYCTNWDGWTHPDPEYYVKLSGHPLKGETGYQRVRAARVNDFLCPLDDERAKNRHGYPTSFEVINKFTGGSIMSLTARAGSILALRERSARHPMPGKEGKGAMHVFADLSCKLLPVEDEDDE